MKKYFLIAILAMSCFFMGAASADSMSMDNHQLELGSVTLDERDIASSHRFCIWWNGRLWCVPLSH
ncbi:MAG: hypothetical protein OEZ58_19675 [Gammaproteobacteria bacterium]|nr:hypothetical protein [Gammaproteobacteria bacterium]